MAATTLVAAPPSAQVQPASLGPDPLWGALVLVVLAVAALFLARRRGQRVRRMQVIESLGLGPRRSLCLARVDGRVLILGVSEAGVQLLSSHDEPAWAGVGDGAFSAQPEGARSPRAESRGHPEGLDFAQPGGTVQPERSRGPLHLAPTEASFEELLTQSTDEQDLRARLQAARVGGT